MVISLFMNMSFIPQLLMDCTNIVSVAHAPPDDLIKRVQDHRSSLIQWRQKWQRSLGPILTFLRRNTMVSMDRFEGYYKLLNVAGSYLSCMILSNRLMTALGQDIGGFLEAESCEIASQISKLNNYIQRDSPQGSLYLTCSLKIAEATLLTTPAWINWACTITPETPTCIPKHVFLRWSSLLGRET